MFYFIEQFWNVKKNFAVTSTPGELKLKSYSALYPPVRFGPGFTVKVCGVEKIVHGTEHACFAVFFKEWEVEL